jgi:hypothetical protein
MANDSIWDSDEGNFPELTATDLLIKACEQLDFDGHLISRVIVMGVTEDGKYIRCIANARSYMERHGMAHHALGLCEMAFVDEDDE